jgi:hypothetical protein
MYGTNFLVGQGKYLVRRAWFGMEDMVWCGRHDKQVLYFKVPFFKFRISKGSDAVPRNTHPKF